MLEIIITLPSTVNLIFNLNPNLFLNVNHIRHHDHNHNNDHDNEHDHCYYVDHDHEHYHLGRGGLRVDLVRVI